MAFKYTITERKNRLKGGTVMKQAVQVNQGRITTREVAEQLQEITSLGRGDVQSVLTHLGDVAARYLREGYSVKLGELGTFTPYIKSKAVEADKDFTTDRIESIRVVFKPSGWLKEAMGKASFALHRDEKGMCPMPPEPDPKETPKPETGGNEIG